MSYSIICPYGEYKRDKIICKALDGELCGHVYYCPLSCKWKQSDQAETCPARKKQEEKKC